MARKIRFPRKATKGKGKLWKKGQSSSFNPECRKYRDGANRNSVRGYQAGGNLTKQALQRLDMLNGNQNLESICEDSDAMSIGDKTFVTSFSDCSNPAFSRLLKNWKSTSLLHKEMLAVLAAVTEVIRSKGGNETETEYFAALMTTLTAVDTNEAVSAVATLLYMIVKRLPAAVRRWKFSDSCKIFVDLLSKYMNSDFNALLRNLIGCLHHFLKAEELCEWTDSTSKIYNVLLEFTTHQKPKVRKTAQDAVVSILSSTTHGKENATVCHPAALSTAQFCIAKLEVSGGQSSPLTFHILGLMKDVIGTFPKASVKTCCETVLRVMTLSDAMITSVCLKVFFGLFSCKIRSNNLPAELNGKLLSALYDYQPNMNDGLPLIDWLCVMEKALINLYSSDEKLCISHLPNFFNAAVKCWMNGQSEVRLAVAESLKNILTSCIEPSKPEFQRLLLENPIDNPVSKMFRTVEGALSYQYHLAWKEVLLVLAIFFDVAGKHLYPVMLKCLQSLADLRDSFKFSHIHELEKAVGVAIHRMGPKVVLQAIPLLITGENDKMDFPRSWLLPLLRDNVKDTELGFFTNYFLPLAAKIRKRVLELEKENKVIESKTYSVILVQIWSILPGFCTNPSDLKHAFKNIAKILGTALQDHKDLRIYILSALRLLITKNLDNEENRSELSIFSKNYLPLLCNLYSTETQDKFEERNRLAVFDTIKVYLQITNKAEIIALFAKAMKKLQDPNLDEFQQHSVLDISRVMFIYVDVEHIKEVYEYCKPLLQHSNKTIQKKSYAVLKELCSNPSANCIQFVKENLEELKALILTSLSQSALPSKALRLVCIEHIIRQLTKENKDFIVSVVPEAVLCTKENSVKVRGTAFSLLVQIGHTLKQWNPDDAKGALRDYMQMLLAGLAGSPHLISATILAIGQVMYEFRGDLDSDVVNLLIENMCLLLSSRSREVVDSALSFVKGLFASFDTLSLAQHVRYLVENIASISEDHQRHFRFKAKEIFTRLVRKFGYELISKMVPASYQKQLANIRKMESRKARRKDVNISAYDESDDDTPKPKGKSDLIEDLLEDSDEEQQPNESVAKTPRKILKRPKKKANAPWIEELGENDIVDLLDPTVNKKILGTKPHPQNIEKPKAATFPTAPDGRLIIREEEDEVKGKKRKALGVADVSIDEMPIECQAKKRKLEDLSDDECDTTSKYQSGGKGIHRTLNKQLGGTEYRAKKAGGDIKKGKYEPFAYIALDKQALNKRKRGKLEGQFKGIVKGAKRGAQKGNKSKSKIAKRRK